MTGGRAPRPFRWRSAVLPTRKHSCSRCTSRSKEMKLRVAFGVWRLLASAIVISLSVSPLFGADKPVCHLARFEVLVSDCGNPSNPLWKGVKKVKQDCGKVLGTLRGMPRGVDPCVEEITAEVDLAVKAAFQTGRDHTGMKVIPYVDQSEELEREIKKSQANFLLTCNIASRSGTWLFFNCSIKPVGGQPFGYASWDGPYQPWDKIVDAYK